jgi:hypothetical protein
MTNANCLEGICCPSCGNEDRFMIAANVVAEVTDDGADLASSHYGNGFEWDDESNCRCPECDKEGPLAEFRFGARPGTRTTPEGFTYSFVHFNRAWYADSIRDSIRVDDEIMVGLYADEGGCRWEFAIRWISLNEPTPRVEVFCDAWQAFAEVPGLFAELARRDDLTPIECCEMLRRLGFTDRTPTGRPS